MKRAEDITTLEYTYTAIFERDEDGMYVVSFPELPGCITQGATIGEARENAADALHVFLTGLMRRKQPIPASEPTVGAPIAERITTNLRTA